MTQTQTTAERIFALIFSNIGYTDGDDRTVASIAAEIDALKAQLAAQDAALVDMPKLAALLATAERERDEARAEAARLRPAAEAWEAAEVANAENANRMSLIMDADAYTGAKAIWLAAQEQADIAAARAREAKESKP